VHKFFSILLLIHIANIFPSQSKETLTKETSSRLSKLHPALLDALHIISRESGYSIIFTKIEAGKINPEVTSQLIDLGFDENYLKKTLNLSPAKNLEKLIKSAQRKANGPKYRG
jgi:hypothetical protein